MPCPYLAFRSANGEVSFGHERPFCTAAVRFVQPMRADICSERYGLEPAADCEIYRDQAAIEDGE